MLKNKKLYLKCYILQQSKIRRLKEMILNFPEKSAEYKAEIASCLKKRKEIEKKVAALDDELLKEVLIQKYFCGKTLEEIGLTMNYSIRHIQRLHNKALEMFKL